MKSSINGFDSGGKEESHKQYEYKSGRILKKHVSKVRPDEMISGILKPLHYLLMGFIGLFAIFSTGVAYNRYKEENPNNKDDMGETIKKVLKTRVF